MSDKLIEIARGLSILKDYGLNLEAHENMLIVGPCEYDDVSVEDRMRLEEMCWAWDDLDGGSWNVYL